MALESESRQRENCQALFLVCFRVSDLDISLQYRSDQALVVEIPDAVPLVHAHAATEPRLVLSCLLALYTAVMSFEILCPTFGLWVFGPGWLLDHSRLVWRRPCSSQDESGCGPCSCSCFSSSRSIPEPAHELAATEPATASAQPRVPWA